MKCTIILIPEDGEDLEHPLVGAWELFSLPRATQDQSETSNSQAVP